MRTICKHLDCPTKASFGSSSDRKPHYCVQHKRAEDIYVNSKACLYPACPIQPAFGSPSERKVLYCLKHKRPDDIDVKSKSCIQDDCPKQPSFGSKVEGKALYCKTHKRAEDVNVTHKKCLHPNCEKHPSFGSEAQGKKLYCSVHRLEGHVNLDVRYCQFPGCNVMACFGSLNDKEPLYCVNHKFDGHVNLISSTCNFNGCKTRASYGIAGKKALYCKIHKEPNHVDLVNKKCQESGCQVIASFGLEKRTPLFCLKHKSTDHVNVVNKLCDHGRCNKQAKCGPLFRPKTKCYAHRSKNDFPKNNPKCLTVGCKVRPEYCSTGEIIPQRCCDHKKENDINIIERECTSCRLLWFIPEGSLCNHCREHAVSKVTKKKETVIKDVLKANDIAFESHDQIPDGSCHKYRPDFVIDFGTHVVILEVDEHQHENYQCLCEQSRMINIAQDFGGLPVCFVRYNPDKYSDAFGHKGLTKDAVRHKRLVQTIKSLALHIPKDLLTVVYMYYDGDNGNNEVVSVNYEELKVRVDEENKCFRNL